MVAGKETEPAVGALAGLPVVLAHGIVGPPRIRVRGIAPAEPPPPPPDNPCRSSPTPQEKRPGQTAPRSTRIAQAATESLSYTDQQPIRAAVDSCWPDRAW